MAITTSQQLKSIVEPLINEVFDGVYKQRAGEWKQVFKQRKGTQRGYHEEPVLYGFGAAPEIPDGNAVTFQSGGQLFNKRYDYLRYGMAFALTKSLVEDGDHIQVAQMFGRHLAQSMVETKETLCANVLNLAFNAAQTGGDGVALVSTSHPLATGQVFSNQLSTAAALSQTSLEQMLIQIANAVDNNGKRIHLTPKQIVTGPSNMFQAETLLKSALRTGTGDNDVNPIKSMDMLSQGKAILSRITSTTAWFVQTDVSNGLSLMMRTELEKSLEGDFQTDNMNYKALERYAVGWTDWRDIFGTSGL